MKNIELRRFEWDPQYMSNVTDKHCVGFIADEIMQYYPKAVTESEENGFTDFKTLDVDQIYKTMYGCVKKIIADKEELESTVLSQAATITNLQNQLDTLQSQMTSLLTQLNITL